MGRNHMGDLAWIECVCVCACVHAHTCDENVKWIEVAHYNIITLIKDQFQMKRYYFKIISIYKQVYQN